MRATASPVKRYAVARKLALYQPERLCAESVEGVQAARPDVLVVAAYGLLLPLALLDVAPCGAWNIHASLLPRWRGAAPIQRALLAGDRETGISIMKMDAGLDTGPILAQRAIPVTDDDDAASLHDRLAKLGGDMIVAALTQIESGTARPVPQAASGATYAPKVEKRETLLDWNRPSIALERAIRAFRPAPGATTVLAGESFKIWRARAVDGAGAPGEVLQAQGELVVACGDGALQVLELQRASGKRLDAQQFLRGHRLVAGDRFG